LQAVNLAIDTDFSNKYVQEMCKNGVGHVEKLYSRTPPDVVRYRKQVSNAFHDGQVNTLVEVLDEVPHGKASWHAYIKKERIKAETCPQTFGVSA
jgi:cytochrome P450